jgi:ribosomal protein S18 acetylase RimI-like enzyme
MRGMTMIKSFLIDNEKITRRILTIQHPAYQIEADLIGFQGIPGLSETVEDIMNSKETFIGYYEDEELLGVLSYEEAVEFVDICRLVVSPAAFRKGIGRQLVTYILEKISGSRDVIVSTGLKNVPAVTLYEKLKFQPASFVEIAPGVQIVKMRYRNN